MARMFSNDTPSGAVEYRVLIDDIYVLINKQAFDYLSERMRANGYYDQYQGRKFDPPHHYAADGSLVR